MNTPRPATTSPRGMARDKIHALLDELEGRGRPTSREDLRPVVALALEAFKAKTAARRVIEALLEVLGGTEA